jgi:hypothetical protein
LGVGGYDALPFGRQYNVSEEASAPNLTVEEFLSNIYIQVLNYILSHSRKP